MARETVKPLLFFLFRAAPVAYESSLARSWIGAAVETYTTATATPDPSCICDLHHSSRPHRILNPIIEARDQTRNLMVPSRIRFHWATTGTPETFNCYTILSILYEECIYYFYNKMLQKKSVYPRRHFRTCTQLIQRNLAKEVDYQS